MIKVSTALTRLLPVMAFVALTAVPAMADTVVFSGSLTTSSPTFNRPTPSGSGLSGQVVPYSLTQLTVNAAGQYIFQSTPLPCPGGMPCFNAALRLYQGSFDPSNPLTNLVPVNGVIESFGPAAFAAVLQPNTTYFLVTTSLGTPNYFNGQAPFTNSISGPGVITLGGQAPNPVPEPATMLLLGTGLTGVLAAARKRRGAKGGGEEV